MTPSTRQHRLHRDHETEVLEAKFSMSENAMKRKETKRNEIDFQSPRNQKTYGTRGKSRWGQQKNYDSLRATEGSDLCKITTNIINLMI